MEDWTLHYTDATEQADGSLQEYMSHFKRLLGGLAEMMQLLKDESMKCGGENPNACLRTGEPEAWESVDPEMMFSDYVHSAMPDVDLEGCEQVMRCGKAAEKFPHQVYILFLRYARAVSMALQAGRELPDSVVKQFPPDAVDYVCPH